MQNYNNDDRMISYAWIKSAGYELYKKYKDNELIRKALLEFEKLIDAAPSAEHVDDGAGRKYDPNEFFKAERMR